jgi:hypothetical protein
MNHRRTWLTSGLASLAVAAVGIAIAVARPDQRNAPPAVRTEAVAASPTADRAIPIATSGWKPGSMSLAALRTGVLRATPDGCPYLAPRDPRSPASNRTPLVWPAGYTARYAKTGKVEVLGPDGTVVVREGDDLSVGGGLIPLTTPEPCTFNATDAFVVMEDLTR